MLLPKAWNGKFMIVSRLRSGEDAYGVLSDVNVLLRAELDQLWLEETRVALDLVGSRGHAGGVDECLEVFLGVVGDTDGASLLLGELGHGLPGVHDGDIIEHLDVAIRVVRLVLKGEEVLVDIAALVEGNGEVNEVEV